ncbi:MAG: GNAT family N-acetyltransferase [Sedimentitalea sp.]|uniref:GNAT family N-acetyltransferase n=1 Tax=Sedimentitalea sp. TaxID=2048915 RepID=UPI003264C4A6
MADAPRCQPLSDEAGWNQLPSDWAMMLENGQGFSIADETGVPGATALALPMGPRIGWISMVLVTQKMRRQGHAKRLLNACVDWFEHSGRISFLDATPAGEPLYRSMGFTPVLELVRMKGFGGGTANLDSLRPTLHSDLPWIAALDKDAIGGERAFILENLLSRNGVVAFVREAQDGYVLSRAGRIATQIGPIIAPSAESAEQLLSAALAAISGPVFIDAVAIHPLVTTLETWGFSKQRPFLRMAKRLNEKIKDRSRLFAAAGPELG